MINKYLDVEDILCIVESKLEKYNFTYLQILLFIIWLVSFQLLQDKLK
jgi:hypothetical protein